MNSFTKIDPCYIGEYCNFFPFFFQFFFFFFLRLNFDITVPGHTKITQNSNFYHIKKGRDEMDSAGWQVWQNIRIDKFYVGHLFMSRCIMVFLTDCLSSSHKQSQAWSHNHIVQCFSSQRTFFLMQHWNTVCFHIKMLVCCWFSFILLFTFKS